jgi:hypothetical protein
MGAIVQTQAETTRARCACGDLVLTFMGQPVLNAICHCADCKRRSGTAFSWQVYLPAENVKLPDAPTDTYTPRSQPDQIRHRCCHCGSTLWWTTPMLPKAIGVAGGMIDSIGFAPPKYEARPKQRLDWCVLERTLDPIATEE